MRQKTIKVPLTSDELAITVEALKVFRQMLVAGAAVDFFSKEQKNLLQDTRVDVEALTEKIDHIWRGK